MRRRRRSALAGYNHERFCGNGCGATALRAISSLGHMIAVPRALRYSPRRVVDLVLGLAEMEVAGRAETQPYPKTPRARVRDRQSAVMPAASCGT
jgi:hypothetical protein